MAQRRHQEDQHEQRDNAEWQVDVEDPAPGRSVGDPPTDDWTEDERGSEDAAEAPLPLGALTRSEEVSNDGDGGRHQAACADTLERAEEDQLLHRLRRAAKERADQEDRESEDQD